MLFNDVLKMALFSDFRRRKETGGRIPSGRSWLRF